MTQGRYTRGDRVRMRADSSMVGRIDGDPVAYAGGWTYPVFFGGSDVRFVPETGLEPAPDEGRVSVLPRTAFLRALLLAKIETPLSDFLYAYQASRTQFEPYQFKPVFKYLDAPVPGILIADEVGLGKTIEAAILYEELNSRARLPRVLVVCPAGLRIKWQAELLNRFDEHFTILKRPDLLADIGLYHETDGAQPLRGITGLETIRGRAILDALAERPVRYDMVIIDEAHHLRTAGRLSNQIGERLSDLTDNLVLLTATPLQTSQQDLFNLLRLLDETQFPQFADFELQLQPNARLNSAIRSLRQSPPDAAAAARSLISIRDLEAGAQVTAHPNYGSAVQTLERGELDRGDAVRLQREIDQMNVISSIYTRTRKRDVSGVAKRQAHVIDVPITDRERDFYEAVLADARAQARRRSKTGWIPGFAGMMRERQAASCMTATREYLVELHRAKRSILGVEDSSTDVVPDSFDESAQDEAGGESAGLLEAAAALGEVDSKFAAFMTALQGAIAESADSKVIVFSYFRRTLAYLERQLRARGFDVLQINGDIAPDKRSILIDRFRTNPRIQILLASEVGAEGLDFQFCDTLFNYDLPWNPMRVEQRIGRIDRYGQQRDKIRIYSFFLEGTIEERILERLYRRIGIFEDSIGDLEPILGPLANALTREIFTAHLTPEEEIEVAARYGDMVIHRREEERALEARSAELLGQDALILQAINETVHAGRYISPAELRAMVDGFLREASVNADLEDSAGDGTALIRGDSKIARAVQEQVARDRDNRPSATAFLGKLQRSGRIPATFDGETAMVSRRLELLNVRHPLVRTAIHHYQSQPHGLLPIVDLSVDDEFAPGPVGEYTFAIFLLSIRGAQTQTRLLPIVVNADGMRTPAIEERLLWLIQEQAVDATGGDWSLAERDGIMGVSTRFAAEEAEQVEMGARERNEAVLAVRRATLERTFRAKITKRRTQILSATDDRIRRLWEGEARNLEVALRERLAELDARRAVGVSFAPIGGGRLMIAPPQERSEEQQPEVAPSISGPVSIGNWPEPPIRPDPWT